MEIFVSLPIVYKHSAYYKYCIVNNTIRETFYCIKSDYFFIIFIYYTLSIYFYLFFYYTLSRLYQLLFVRVLVRDNSLEINYAGRCINEGKISVLFYYQRAKSRSLKKFNWNETVRRQFLIIR